MLDSTLVIWGGEFGRSPVAENGKGRDHHPKGFTMWMAGGGIKGGLIHGATDEFGYSAIENRVSVPDPSCDDPAPAGAGSRAADLSLHGAAITD